MACACRCRAIKRGAIELRSELGQHVAAIAAREQGALGGGIGIVQRQPQHEAIELRIRQGEGAIEIEWILCGDDEEWLGQRMGLAVHGDLVLGHGFEQRALRLGAGAVDLVGQQQAGEDRAGMKAELAGFALVHADADDVRRQQVAGELHALEFQREAWRPVRAPGWSCRRRERPPATSGRPRPGRQKPV